MKRFWLAACAAGMLTAAPAHALDIRVDPAPLYVFDTSPDRGVVDVVLQNVLVVNDERRARDLTGLRVELWVGDQMISQARVPAERISRRAERIAGMGEAGLLRMMDFQFHLSTILHEGERLSADATLEPGEAYLNTSLYVASSTMPDRARVVAEGARGDLGHTDVPVSRYQSPNQYRAPVDGRWFVFASADAAHHHRWVVSSEYAIDIAQLGESMRSHSGDGSRLADYPTFGQPIHAIADGVVVAARDDRIDNEGMLRQAGETFEAYMERSAEAQQAIMTADGFEGAAGNYVLIRHANGEHSLYAHMREGSVHVRVGDAVSSGAVIGAVGSSGNSTEPHLHFQIIDGPDLNRARGLPFVFEGLREDWLSMHGRHLRAGDVLERE